MDKVVLAESVVQRDVLDIFLSKYPKDKDFDIIWHFVSMRTSDVTIRQEYESVANLHIIIREVCERMTNTVNFLMTKSSDAFLEDKK